MDRLLSVLLSPAHIAKLAGSGGYCTGTLIGPQSVLTCAHYFRSREDTLSSVTCFVAGQRRRIAQLDRLPGTDIAVVKLSKPIRGIDEFPTFGPPPGPLAPTVTLGFGGAAAQPAGRVGRYITSLPIAASRSLATIVRPAGIILNSPRAVKGDSGGPVLVDGHVVAVQSLILELFGVNLGMATVSLVDAEAVQRIVDKH